MALSASPIPGETRPPLPGGSFALGQLPLKTKLLLSFLLIFTISMFIILISDQLSTRQLLANEVGLELQWEASEQAFTIGERLEGRVDQLRLFGLSKQVQDSVVASNARYEGTPAEIEAELQSRQQGWAEISSNDTAVQSVVNNDLARELRTFLQQEPSYRTVLITDQYGAVVAASERPERFYNADQSWWQAAYKGGQGTPTIGQPVVDPASQIPVSIIAMPIYAQGSPAVIGLLQAHYLPTELVRDSSENAITSDHSMDLIFPSGGGIMHEGSFEQSDPNLSEVLPSLTNAPQEMVYEGQNNFASVAPVQSISGLPLIESLGWQVLVHEPTALVFEPLNRQLFSTLLLSLVVVAVGGFLIFVVSRQLVNPLSGLTDVVQRFTAGDLTARAPVTTQDEVGFLATNFNTMAERLGASLTNFESRGQELEVQRLALEERTRELEASQRVTFAASERTDPDTLLDLVTNLIRDQFDLYHVQVYLVDQAQRAAVLRESTGYAGRQLLQRGHKIPLDQPSLVTRSIQEGSSVLVGDVKADPNFLPNPLLPDTRAELVVPLRIGDRVIGALDAQSRTPDRFSASTMTLFQTMAEQIAFLFENSELLNQVSTQAERLQRFADQLRTAAELANRLGSILDLDALLNEAVSLLQSRFGLYHVHLYLLDPQTNLLTVRAGSGEVGKVLRERSHSIALENEGSIVARTARERIPVVVDDITAVADFLPNPLLPQTRAEAAIPLVVRGMLLGVLDIQDDRPSRFSQADLDTFNTLAGQIATAIENASLFDRVETSLEETRVRLEISQAFTGLRSEEKVLETILERAAFNREARTAVYLFEERDGERVLVLQTSSVFDSGLSDLPVGTVLNMEVWSHNNLVRPDAPLISGDMPNDERMHPMARELTSRIGALSLLSVPITSGGEWLGVIVASAKPQNYFNPGRAFLYQSIADRAGIALNASRLRQATEEARATAERERTRLSQILDVLPAGVYVANREGNPTLVNAAAIDLLGGGMDPNVVPGQYVELYDLIDVETGTAFDTNELPLVKTLADGQSHTSDRLAVRKSDGVVRSIFVNSTPLYEGETMAGAIVAFVDVTERQEARAEAERERRRLSAILNNLPVGVFVADRQGAPTLVNSAAVELLGRGIEPGAASGVYSEVYDLLDMETGERIDNNQLPVVQSLADGRPHTSDRVAVRRGDGTSISLFINSAPLYEGDTMTGAMAAFVDVTERQEARAAVERERTRLSTILNSLPVGVFVADRQGVPTLVNSAAVELLGRGIEPGAVADQYSQLYDLLDGQTGELIDNNKLPLVQTLGDGRPHTSDQVTVRHADGKTLSLFINSSPIFEGETMTGAMAAFVDITERRRTELALRDSEARIQALLDNSPAVIYVKDLDGRYLLVNRQYEQLFHVSRHEVIGKTDFEIFPKEVAETIRINDIAVAESENAMELEEVVPQDDGLHTYVSLKFQLRDSSGTAYAICGISTDITERKQSERAVIQRGRLNALRADVSRLLTESETAAEALQPAAEAMTLHTDAVFARIWLLNQAQQRLELQASAGLVTELTGPYSHIPVGETPIGQVAATHKAFVANDFINSAEGDDRIWAEQQELTSCAIYPLTLNERLLGVMALFSRNEIDLETQEALAATADVLALGLERSAAETERQRFIGQLRIAAEVSDQINSILDPALLLKEVVSLIQSRLDLYHVHVYTLNDQQQLVMQVGTGEVGAALRARGHSIALDRPASLVARAARQHEIIVVNETRQEPGFLPNPLLPDTRSEVAVPLIVGNQVLGVLDVQDDSPGRFSQADLSTLNTLAGHIATAIENARLFERVQQSLLESQIRYEVSRQFAEAQTEAQVLDVIAAHAKNYADVQFTISTLEGDANDPIFVTRRVVDTGSDMTVVEPGSRFTVADFPLLRFMSPDEVFVSSNLQTDERADEVSRETAKQFGTVSMIVVPIKAGNDWMGSISALSAQEGFFDDYTRFYLLQTVAEQGASALRAARLFDETQRTSEELRQMDRLKSEFLANMSHELRTPLNSIIGYAEITLMGINGELEAETRQDIQAIHDNGQHLLRLINDVLDLAKIEAGRMTLEVEELDLRNLLDEVQVANAGLLMKKPVELWVEVEESLPSIQGDHLRLSQVLTNLISNAVKFTDEGHVRIRAFREDGHVCIEVEDSGIGMSEENLNAIFEAFHQGQGPRARRAEGTGLGLAITRHLIHMHGGSIDVRSQLGQGSTFTVRLPLQSEYNPETPSVN